jgi:hypothetical protein
MSVSAESLVAIGDLLESAGAGAATVAELRRRFPGLTVTRCDAHDVVDETPFQTFAGCNLYLLDGRDHCFKITSDPAAATGLVLSPTGAEA